MHDAFNDSLNVCRYMRRHGRTEQLDIIGFSAVSLALRVIFVRRKRPQIYASCMTISGGRTKQLDIIGFGESSRLE